MHELRIIQCPYCGHTQPVLIDWYSAIPEHAEHCQHCGRSMVVRTLVLSKTTIRISVQRVEP